MNASARFFAKVEPAADGSGCLLWTGGLTVDGYGTFHFAGRLWRAHRWLMERGYGPIAPGLVIDHLCRNRRCVRPSHLEIVTITENVLRGDAPALARERSARITHCPRGHAYDEANTYLYARRDGVVSRRCRACEVLKRRTPARRAYQREYQRKLRANRIVLTVVATLGSNGVPEVEVIRHRARDAKAVAA